MPAVHSRSPDLFRYDSEFRVLICRECQYAVERSALTSHLLRHKIYRGERQLVLSSIDDLAVSEPHAIIPPSPTHAPIEDLSVIPGYRCLASGCGHLCASLKRMRRHCTESHDSSPSFDALVRAASLQTFFRSTKLRYFEVRGKEVRWSDHDHSNRSRRDTEENGGRQPYSDIDCVPEVSDSSLAKPMGTDNLNDTQHVNINLDSLVYFHHFITKTCLTLPVMDDGGIGPQYWSTTLITLALEDEHLMCGLLAIAACHLAATAIDAASRPRHRQHYERFAAKFSAGEDHNGRNEANERERGAAAVCQASRLLAFVHLMFDMLIHNQTIVLERMIASHDIIKTLRSVTSRTSSQPTGTDMTETRNPFEMNRRRTSRIFWEPDDKPHLPDILRTLPSQMRTTLGRPKNRDDVLATLSAIENLFDAYETGYTSDDPIIASWAMLRWLTMIPERFDMLVARDDPAALVVVAYWAALLIKRAEHLGCWYLGGLANKVVSETMMRLYNQGNVNAIKLIEDLVNR